MTLLPSPILGPSRDLAFLGSPLSFCWVVICHWLYNGVLWRGALGGTAGSCQPGWSKMTLSVNRLLPGDSGDNGV